MDAAEPVRLAVELQAGSRPIRGRLVDEGGNAHPFGSWLELISVLNAAADRVGAAEHLGTAGRGDGSP